MTSPESGEPGLSEREYWLAPVTVPHWRAMLALLVAGWSGCFIGYSDTAALLLLGLATVVAGIWTTAFTEAKRRARARRSQR